MSTTIDQTVASEAEGSVAAAAPPRTTPRQRSVLPGTEGDGMGPLAVGVDPGVLYEEHDDNPSRSQSGPRSSSPTAISTAIDSDSSNTSSPPRPPLTATTASVSAQRWKSAISKTIHAKRVMSLSKAGWDGGSREPGIDPRRVEIPGLKEEVVVQVVDFSSANAQFSILKNQDVAPFLAKPRPSFAKARWIHVNGISWDVVKPTALEYNLHPLALEDMLQNRASSRKSKSSYYKQHLYLSLVVHKAGASEDDSFPTFSAGGEAESSTSTLGEKDLEAGSLSKGDARAPVPDIELNFDRKYEKDLKGAFGETVEDGGLRGRELEGRTLNAYEGVQSKPLHSRKLGKMQQASRAGGLAERQAARYHIESLTKADRVHIHIEQLSIFVCRSGTIITFTQDPGYHSRFSKIFNRIHAPSDIIRETEDHSFILQALLDVVADHALEIVEEFRDQLTKLESRVLSSPDMGDVRHLHVLSAQLLLLKFTLSPFQQLLQQLRLVDGAKSAAASRTSSNGTDENRRAEDAAFVSYDAKIYLGDVMDHVDSVLASFDLFANLAENLISYIFNNLSYSSNSYMQALSVLSVIFLPLTFLSGYFGMNFNVFHHVIDEGNSNAYFWKIAIPSTVGAMIIFSWTYLKEMYLKATRDGKRIYLRSMLRKREE